MNPLEKLIARHKTLCEQRDAILGNEAATAEDLNNADKLIGDIKTVERQLAMVRSAAAEPPIDVTPPAGFAAPEARSVTVGRDLAADRPFASFGEQLLAIRGYEIDKDHCDPRIKRTIAGSSTQIGAEGGLLIQQDFSTDLLKRTFEVSKLLPKVTRITIGSNANSLKLATKDETSRASGSRWGGVSVAWVSEGIGTSASAPKVKAKLWDLNKLMGLFYATQELIEDAAALDSLAMLAFPEEFAFEYDDAILRGTGVGEPLGIINSGAYTSVAKETNQSADTIVAQNIMNMYSRMHPAHLGNAEWYINQECLPQLWQMNVTAGMSGASVFMPPGGLSGAPYATLYGHKINVIEQASALGDLGDIMFADLSAYVMVGKGGLRQDQSIHVHFLTDQTAFRWIQRAGGRPTYDSPITPYKGAAANTISPFVLLAERA